MKYLYSLNGEQTNIKNIILRHGGTTILPGAAVMKGVTSGTNFGFGIVATGTAADVIGVTEQTLLSTATDTDQAGLTENKVKCTVNPFGVFLAEWSQASADLITVDAAGSSGTTVNIASIEDITGGWLYVVSGTGAGQLQYITAAGSGTLTTKTAFSPVLDGTSKVIKITPRFSELQLLNSTADKLASAAAAGTAKMCILESFIQANTVPFIELSAPAHSGLTGLNTQSIKLFSAVVFLDSAFNIGA